MKIYDFYVNCTAAGGQCMYGTYFAGDRGCAPGLSACPGNSVG